jgi:hypothetical protein
MDTFGSFLVIIIGEKGVGGLWVTGEVLVFSDGVLEPGEHHLIETGLVSGFIGFSAHSLLSRELIIVVYLSQSVLPQSPLKFRILRPTHP